MTYNSSGVYTRVDNSFSNPVTGTTISPTDADSYFDDIDAALNAVRGTSTTSLAIGTGSKTFTTQTGKLFQVGKFVLAQSDANPTVNYMYGQVTAYSSTTLTVNVTAIGGSGTLADWTIFESGAQGASGPIAGFRQTYSTTTADADPGAGIFRLNNATPASATAAYFDNVDANGTTITTNLDRMDDHGNSSGRGILRAEKETDSAVWAEWLVTGSIVDGTGYRKATLSGGSGSGAFTASDTFRFAFFPKGDNGAIGGTAGTTDNAGVRADGTGGGTLQVALFGNDDSGNLYPLTTDTGALGTSSLMWADAFFASGAVLNFNNGNYTVTHSAGALTTNGALSISTSNAFTCGTIELGAASDTTLARAAAGVISVEGVSLFPNLPVNNKSAAYTTVLADANQGIVHPSSDNNARTFTIDSNANVAYPIGTFITFQNQINTVTIAITSDTLTLQGAGTTGSRTLAANGIATAWKVDTTKWVINGTGLT